MPDGCRLSELVQELRAFYNGDVKVSFSVFPLNGTFLCDY